RNLSTYAARIYFLIIVLQVPLFRSVECISGICTSPIQVTCSQLISSGILPVPLIKGLLYPGAILNGVITDFTLPSWSTLLTVHNMTQLRDAPLPVDIHRLEVLAGSYFCVAGSLIGIMKAGRMSMFGTLLVLWGLIKEGLLGKPVNRDPTKAVFVHPAMLLALICAFSSVRYDLKRAAAASRSSSSASVRN
ncbi:hypothetical protein M569_15977, partial [Genlisea aurea]